MRIFVVFVLPVILSVALGTAVLNGVVAQPDRELNMWPFGGGHGSSGHLVWIIGLSEEYSTSEPVEVALQVGSLPFSCGDIYVTIYDTASNTAVTQSGFLSQCFDMQNPIHQVGFSEIIDTPGSYALTVQIVSEGFTTIDERGLFTVK